MLKTKEQVILTRIFKFSASHRLFISKLSREKNLALFGQCSNSAGHGHDYSVEVSVRGEIDDETGAVINLIDFEKLSAPIIEQFDYKWIDRDIPFFKENTSTIENIGKYLWGEFKEVIPEKLHSIKVWENSESYVEYSERK